MSLTANLPRGGYSVKASQHMGLVGLTMISAESPFLMDLGSFSMMVPFLRSILAWISANLQAMWEVWQSRTGVYPFQIWPGWFMMMTWARNSSTSLGGSLVVLPQTQPRFRSFTATFLMLKPTLSPGMASGTDSWCLSTDFTQDLMLEGAKQTFIPGLRIPVSTLPTGTVPIPPILQTSCRGNLSGFSVGRLGASIKSSAWIRVGPLYQGVLVDFSIRLSPFHPEIGMNGTFSGLYPIFLMKSDSSFLISLQRSSEQFTVCSSILLRQTIICFTPRVQANRACSLVWPSFEMPASNSPLGLAIMSTAQSAWEVPVIIFLMKSLCPGASMMVMWYLTVQNCQREISMVIPLSRSDLSLSITQAYLKDPLPASAASFSNLSMVRLSIPPHLQMRCPVDVDFPESTWPMTTMLMWSLSFFCILCYNYTLIACKRIQGL